MKGCLGKVIRFTLIGIGVLLVLGIIVAIFAPKKPATTGTTQTVALAPTVKVMVAATVESMVTPLPTNTPRATRTPRPTATPTTIQPTSTPTPPAFLVRCLDVPSAMIDAIATGLTVDGGGTLDATTAQAVRSGDFAKVYFIAAAIHGQGFGDKGKVGIWASNSLTPGNGLIMAIDGFAVEFSEWGDGSKTDAHLSQTDDGAQDSAKCVAYKQDHR